MEGLYLTKNNSVCSHCIDQTGGCCGDVHLVLTPEERIIFQKVFDDNKSPDSHTLEVYDKEVYLYDSKEENCMFLKEDNQCGIYDSRPLICCTYPILWEEEETSYDLNYFIDFACPLSHRVTMKEFAHWVDINKRKIKDMGELDFDSADSQYVNLSVLRSEVNVLELVTDPNLLP